MSNEAEFPLVLSMTEFGMFRRCRKKFELGAIMGLSPRRDTEAASNGRDFHSIMEWVAKNGGEYPQENTLQLKPFAAMLPVAQAYYDHLVDKDELSHFDAGNLISAERGYFAEIGPNIFIRTSFDLVFLDDGEGCVQDYKTFTKAPSLDAESDLDPQANEYLLVAAAAMPQLGRLKFRWEYVRQELGRMLKKGPAAVYTPWEREERYYRQELIVSDDVMNTVRKELYDCALDVREAIERGRYYRQGLNSGPHGCSSCFYKDLCKAELFHGSLDDQTLAALSTYDDPAQRTSAETMLADPRVLWYEGRGDPTSSAIAHVYGPTGESKFRESAHANA